MTKARRSTTPKASAAATPAPAPVVPEVPQPPADAGATPAAGGADEAVAVAALVAAFSGSDVAPAENPDGVAPAAQSDASAPATIAAEAPATPAPAGDAAQVGTQETETGAPPVSGAVGYEVVEPIWYAGRLLRPARPGAEPVVISLSEDDADELQAKGLVRLAVSE